MLEGKRRCGMGPTSGLQLPEPRQDSRSQLVTQNEAGAFPVHISFVKPGW